MNAADAIASILKREGIELLPTAAQQHVPGMGRVPHVARHLTRAVVDRGVSGSDCDVCH